MRGNKRRFRWRRGDLYLRYTTEKVGDESMVERAIEQVTAYARVRVDLVDII
jgi:hypothetical protein